MEPVQPLLDNDDDPLTSCSAEVRRVRPSSRVTVEPVLFLYSISSVLYYPLTQQYIYMRVSNEHNFTRDLNVTQCSINHSDPQYIKQQEIQSDTSRMLIYCNITYLGLAFFSAIFLGGYTDIAGRKLGIMAPIFGGLLNLYLLMFIMIYELPYQIILVGTLLQGICGGYVVFLMAAFSYISDITSCNERSLRVILLEFFLTLGGVVAYLSSGYLIQYAGFKGTVLTLQLVIIFTLFWTVFLVPESVVKDDNVTFWTTKHFRKSFHVYLRDDGTGRRWFLIATMLLFFIVAAARLGTDDVVILFTFNSPLCWNSIQYGYYKSGLYFICNIGNILLTKFLQPKLGDLALVAVGCTSGAASSIYLAFADTSIKMIFAPLIGVFQLIPIGMIRAFNSKIVEPTEYGAMFAWVAWMESLGNLVGNATFDSIYAATLIWFKGFTFIVIAVVFLLSTAISIMIIIRLKKVGFMVHRDLKVNSICERE